METLLAPDHLDTRSSMLAFMAWSTAGPKVVAYEHPFRKPSFEQRVDEQRSSQACNLLSCTRLALLQLENGGQIFNADNINTPLNLKETQGLLVIRERNDRRLNKIRFELPYACRAA